METSEPKQEEVQERWVKLCSSSSGGEMVLCGMTGTNFRKKTNKKTPKKIKPKYLMTLLLLEQLDVQRAPLQLSGANIIKFIHCEKS